MKNLKSVVRPLVTILSTGGSASTMRIIEAEEDRICAANDALYQLMGSLSAQITQVQIEI
jgi:hypothetical protein